MQWQERLRTLDHQLAAGELTPAEHRLLADELLAEAAGPRRAEPEPAVEEPLPAPEEPAPARFVEPTRPPLSGVDLFTNTQEPGRPWIGVLIAVLALALVGAGLWWLLSDPTGDPTGGPPSAQPTATTTATSAPAGPADPAAALMAALPELPGTAIGPPALVPSGIGTQLGLYPPAVAKATAGGLGLVDAASIGDGTSYAIAALDSPDATTATAAVDYAVRNGWAEVDRAPLPDGVTVLRTSPSGRDVHRAVYRSGRWTVLLTVSITGTDPDAARTQFDLVAARLVAAVPPG